jgi:hypothetical protein
MIGFLARGRDAVPKLTVSLLPTTSAGESTSAARNI